MSQSDADDEQMQACGSKEVKVKSAGRQEESKERVTRGNASAQMNYAGNSLKSPSEVTIYTQAVEMKTSGSSLDLSDNLANKDSLANLSLSEEMNVYKDNLIVDKPGTSRDDRYKLPPLPQRTERSQTNDDEKQCHKEEEAELIKLAEASKAKLLQPEGKEEYDYRNDDKFFYLSSHVEKLLQDRIKRGM